MSHPHILDGKWGTIARWADGETVSTDRLTAELLHLLANFGNPVVAERDALAARLAAVEALVADPPVILNHGELALRYSRLRAALATGTKGQACVHCGRRFTGSAHDEGDHRGKQRCDPDDTGQPYGLNAHAPGTPCQSPCAGARATQEADQ